MPETRPSYATLALRNEVTDVAGASILSATSEAALFRKSELASPQRSRRWRSTSNGQQQIVGAFASSVTPRLTALIDSNLDTPAGDIANALAALNVWMRAYDIAQADASAISAWANAGSSGGSFAQGTSGNRPTYRTAQIDSKPVVRFDGTDDLFDNSPNTIALGTVHTIVVVAKLTTVGATVSQFIGGPAEYLRFSSNTLVYANSAGNTVSVAWTPTVSEWHCIRVVRNGTNVSFYVDGTQVGTTQVLAGNSTFTLRYIGLATTATIHGDIAEIMISTDAAFEANGYGLALQDFLYARYLGSAAASGLVTMALSSLLVEFHTSSAFGATGQRWALQSYDQTNRRTLSWYTREPDSLVPAALAALRASPDPVFDVFFGTTFWRLTFPAGGVLDSDGDGVLDTYHELGVPWFGNYTELPIDFGLSTQVMDPSFVSESDAGTRFVDRLSSYHEVDINSSANLEAVSYALLSQIDQVGTSRLCLLDVWASRSDKVMRAMGCYYGRLDKGTKLTRKIVGRDDISATFVEARA